MACHYDRDRLEHLLFDSEGRLCELYNFLVRGCQSDALTTVDLPNELDNILRGRGEGQINSPEARRARASHTKGRGWLKPSFYDLE